MASCFPGGRSHRHDKSARLNTEEQNGRNPQVTEIDTGHHGNMNSHHNKSMNDRNRKGHVRSQKSQIRDMNARSHASSAAGHASGSGRQVSDSNILKISQKSLHHVINHSNYPYLKWHWFTDRFEPVIEVEPETKAEGEQLLRMNGDIVPKCPTCFRKNMNKEYIDEREVLHMIKWGLKFFIEYLAEYEHKCCWQRELADIKVKHQELIDTNKELKNRLKQSNASLQSFENSGINGVNGHNGHNGESVEKLRNDLNRYQEAYKYRNERYEYYKKEWAEEKEKNISLLQQFNEATNASREWEIKYDELNDELQRLRQSKDGKALGLNVHYNEENQGADRRRSEVDRLQNEMQNLQRRNEKYQRTIQELKDQLASEDKTLEVTRLMDDNDNLREKLAEMDRVVKELESNVDDLETTNGSYDEELKRAQAEIDDLKEQIKEHDVQTERIEQGVAFKTQQIERLEDDLIAANAKIEELESLQNEKENKALASPNDTKTADNNDNSSEISKEPTSPENEQNAQNDPNDENDQNKQVIAQLKRDKMTMAQEAEMLRQENERQLNEIERLQDEISQLKKQRKADAVRSPDRTLKDLDHLRVKNEDLQLQMKDLELQMNEKDRKIDALEEQLEFQNKQRKNNNFAALVATPDTDNDTPLSELSQGTGYGSDNDPNNAYANGTHARGIPKIEVGNNSNLHELKEQDSDVPRTHNSLNSDSNQPTPATGMDADDNESKLTDMNTGSPADSDVVLESQFTDENGEGTHQSRVTGMMCHPMRDMCVSIAHDGEIRLWSMDPSVKAKSKQVRCYKQSRVNGRALCLAFSGNGEYLCIGGGYKNSANGMIYVFYIGSGDTPDPSAGPDSLASTHAEGSLVFRHVSDDDDLDDGIIRNGEFHSVAFSRDGNFILAGDNTGQITVFDVKQHRPVSCLNESSDVIHCLYPWRQYMFVCTPRMVSVIDLKHVHKLGGPSKNKIRLRSNIIYQTGQQSYEMKVVGVCQNGSDAKDAKEQVLIIGNARKLESLLLPSNLMKDKVTMSGIKISDKVDQKEMNGFTTVRVHNKHLNYFIAARKDNHTPKVFDVGTGKTVKGCKYRAFVAFVDFVYDDQFNNYCIICCQDYEHAGKGTKKPLPVQMKMWKFKDK